MKSRTTILVSLATTLALFASSVPAVKAQDADAVPMSLIECLTGALENNLDLAIAKKDPEIALNNVTFQKATFDPVFVSDFTYRGTKQDLTPVIRNGLTVYAPQTGDSEFLSAGIKKTFSFGATLDVTFSSARSSSNPASNSGYDPQYQSALDFATFKLPLLRGFGKEVNEFDLLVAKTNVSISDEELRAKATDILRNVEDAYWDLLATRKAQEVAEQALKLAQDLYELNKKKVEVGTLAPIEITQAEANVAANVEGVITSKAAVKNAEDNLRRLLAIPAADPLWAREIIPTEVPSSGPSATKLDDAIATALQARPEVVAARMQVDNAELGERVAKKNAWHNLDLLATFRPSGNNLESIQNVPVDPDGVPNSGDEGFIQVLNAGGVGTAIAEIPKLNNYDWSIGLTYAVPIYNRANKATYANATIGRQKAVISEQNTEELVRVDVRRAVRAVESGYERSAAARKNVELQQKKLDAEQKKFDNGMSTSFEVFTFQTDLRNAQLSLIRALLDYNKALADLERAKGTLLESKGLKLADNAGR